MVRIWDHNVSEPARDTETISLAIYSEYENTEKHRNRVNFCKMDP